MAEASEDSGWNIVDNNFEIPKCEKKEKCCSGPACHFIPDVRSGLWLKSNIDNLKKTGKTYKEAKEEIIPIFRGNTSKIDYYYRKADKMMSDHTDYKSKEKYFLDEYGNYIYNENNEELLDVCRKRYDWLRNYYDTSYEKNCKTCDGGSKNHLERIKHCCAAVGSEMLPSGKCKTETETETVSEGSTLKRNVFAAAGTFLGVSSSEDGSSSEEEGSGEGGSGTPSTNTGFVIDGKQVKAYVKSQKPDDDDFWGETKKKSRKSKKSKKKGRGGKTRTRKLKLKKRTTRKKRHNKKRKTKRNRRK